MTRWELRKLLNAPIIFSSLFLCMAWFFVCKFVFIGNYEDINGEIYRSYISELSAMTFEEQSAYIENERSEIGLTLSAAEEMRKKYLHGEIPDGDYLDFLERYNSCVAKSPTFRVIDAKFARITENRALKFFYDLELEGHLSAMTADFPLIIMICVIGGGVFIADIPAEPFILTCKNGRAKTYFAKLAAYFIICFALTAAFNLSELAALFSKDLGDLSVPAASMEKFAAVDTGIDCKSLIIRTFSYRILAEISLCVLLFGLSAFCGNHIVYFCSASALIMIPSFFAAAVPRAFKGAFIYYGLAGNSVLNDNTGLSVLLGAAAAVILPILASSLKRLKH